jgi:hypothetical protein
MTKALLRDAGRAFVVPDLAKPVILREAPRSAFVSRGSMAPTEESLSETAGSVRHGCVPGDAPEEGSARGEGDSSVAPTGAAVFPEVRGGRSLRMTRVSSNYECTRSDETVILREAPRSALPSPGSMAPTEESLSGTAGSFRHGCVPGDARERVPREGKEILWSRQRVLRFPGSPGWRSLRMTRVSSNFDCTRSDKPVILREAPRSTVRPRGSMAPTEESLSETAGSFHHGCVPGDARKEFRARAG